MGNERIDSAGAYPPDESKNLNDHIPEEGTEDYEYTDYSQTNKTNEQKVNAISESERHKEMLSERLAPATAAPRDYGNSELDPLSNSNTNQTPMAGYGR